MTILTKLDQIRSEAIGRIDNLSRIPEPAEQEKRDLLLWLRTQTEKVLSEERVLEFPAAFIEESFHLKSGASVRSILEAWVSKRLLFHREQTLGDIDEAEWQCVLNIAHGVIGKALESPRIGIRPKSHWKDLIIRHALYEKNRSSGILQAAFQGKRNDLSVTLRMIEAVHRETPFCITMIEIPPALAPDCGATYQPRQVYRWHSTSNEAVPKVCILADGRMILRFAREATLRKVKELLRPFPPR